MKRILVVDPSPAVRETIALVLGREFAVSQRSPLAEPRLLSPEETGFGLVIFGSPPGLGGDSAVLRSLAAHAPCPILFLVGSRRLARVKGRDGRVDYLAKPFDPYALKEKVERLLADTVWPASPPSQVLPAQADLARYIEFPFLPASLSALIKSYALCRLPVLIVGEVGSREERVAGALHAMGERHGVWVAARAPELTRECLRNRFQSLSFPEGEAERRVTLFLSGLETLDRPAQSSLLGFLDEIDSEEADVRLLSSSRADLLERVYRGEFLDDLYYRLATLVAKLPPLRERQADIAQLAARLAEDFGERLGLGKVDLSPDATARLASYLWFGNLAELETVIGRTLARSRKSTIAASDLIFGDEAPPGATTAPSAPPQFSASPGESAAGLHGAGPGAAEPDPVIRSGNGDYRDIRVLINELAHELKNPMVTIKTFTQLLGDRYDDETFRNRFQATVGNDIERMDELLETLLDFSRFNPPAREKVLICEQLRRAVESILPEPATREAAVRWGSLNEASAAFVDKEQLHYALCNVLRAVVSQVKPREEIRIDVEGDGRVAIAYDQEAGQMSSLAHYLELSSVPGEETGLPLRILLAKILLRRIGGGLAVNRDEGGKIRINANLPVE